MCIIFLSLGIFIKKNLEVYTGRYVSSLIISHVLAKYMISSNQGKVFVKTMEIQLANVPEQDYEETESTATEKYWSEN